MFSLRTDLLKGCFRLWYKLKQLPPEHITSYPFEPSHCIKFYWSTKITYLHQGFQIPSWKFLCCSSTRFALSMRLVISLFPTTTTAITFVLFNLQLFDVWILSCFPACLLDRLSKIEQLLQPMLLFFLQPNILYP